MRNLFIEALNNKDINMLRKISKSDLHNHGVLGGNLNYINKKFGLKIEKPRSRFNTIEDMGKWIKENSLVDGIISFENNIEAALIQAKNDGVKVLEMSFDTRYRNYFEGKVENLISVLDNLHKSFAPDVIFRPEISLNREIQINILEEQFEPYLDFEYFKSIDLCGNEYGQSIKSFKNIYKKAKNKGLTLKAHVGEFGDAISIIEAIEELELNQIQHGISAINSKEVMRYLRNNKIPLNICPTSNVMLNRVSSLANHPIREFYDYGIKVTINTDDVLVFNQGVSEEFLSLFNESLFTADELNKIRETGLENSN